MQPRDRHTDACANDHRTHHKGAAYRRTADNGTQTNRKHRIVQPGTTAARIVMFMCSRRRKTSHVATLDTWQGRIAAGPNQKYWCRGSAPCKKEQNETYNADQQANEACSEKPQATMEVLPEDRDRQALKRKRTRVKVKVNG